MSLAELVCLGLNHNTAPVELREQVSMVLERNAGQDAPGEEGLSAPHVVLEQVMLSTCNRVELYVLVAPDSPNAITMLYEWLLESLWKTDENVADHIYCHRGWAAVEHLYRVAASLDSLVLGESQILGQVSEAFAAATLEGTAGPYLGAIFRSAIRAGKRTRAETGIGRKPASVSSVSITLAESVVSDLRRRQVLVVGLGEMGRLSLKALRDRGVENVAVANRTRSRADKLAARHGYRVFDMDDLPVAVSAADVVICATGSTEPVLEQRALAPLLGERTGRDLVLIDIAVPRDVEASVAALPGVHLFDMNDLQAGLDETLAARQAQVPAVEAVLEQEQARLKTELRELTMTPLIRALRLMAEEIRQSEVERTFDHLGEVDSETAQHIQHLSRSLVNKLLHQPTARLRAQAHNGHADTYVATVSDLFGLEDGYPCKSSQSVWS